MLNVCRLVDVALMDVLQEKGLRNVKRVMETD